MKKKQIVDLVTAIFLIICGGVLLVFPLFHFVSVKPIFMAILGVYGFLNLIQFLLTKEAKDYEGLFTTIASVIALIVAWRLDIAKTPWYLALTLFIWIIMMALIKMKKADYYNDRHDSIWILKIVTLMLFILTGLLATINLYYEADVQILVLGFFFLVHGMLELFDPLTNYLMMKK